MPTPGPGRVPLVPGLLGSDTKQVSINFAPFFTSSHYPVPITHTSTDKAPCARKVSRSHLFNHATTICRCEPEPKFNVLPPLSRPAQQGVQHKFWVRLLRPSQSSRSQGLFAHQKLTEGVQS